MIKRILVCIDGSMPYTESVCQDAMWMAQKTKASLVVLYVSDIRQFEISMVTDFSGSLGVQPYQNLYMQLQEMEREKTRIIQQQVEKIFAPMRDRVTFYQRTGIMVDILHEFESSEMGVDLIVLGKRGENVNFATEHLGSTMERIVRSSTKPCLVSSRDHREIKRILIAYDASPSVHKAIQFLARSEDFRDLEVHLVTAVHDLENTEMVGHIQRTEAILQNAGYNVHHKVVNGEPEEVVSEYVERHGIRMVVMGAYGHSTIRHLLIGSTTTNLVRRCHIPILMFR
jgi:nucleotide-binding universal stress UspA family protein